VRGGVLIALGRVFPPPYRIECRDWRTTVNGIQVLPSPIPRRVLAGERHRSGPYPGIPLLEQTRRRLEAIAVGVLRNKRLPMRDAARRRDVLRVLETDARVREARWTEARCISVTLRFPGNPRMALVPSIALRPPLSAAQRRAGARRHQRELIGSLYQALRAGRSVIFGGPSISFRDLDPRPGVLETLSDPRLSLAQRIRRLDELVSPEAAFEVLANFDPADWRAS